MSGPYISKEPIGLSFTTGLGLANGAAWPSTWTTSGATAGFTNDVQSVKLRNLTAATGGFASTARGFENKMALVADGVFYAELTTEAALNDTSMRFMARVSSTGWGTISTEDPSYYIKVQQGSGNWLLAKMVAAAETALATVTFSWSTATTYGLWLSLSGTTVQGKVSTTLGGGPPSTWDATQTDSGVTAAGTIATSCQNGSAAAARTALWDKITAYQNGVYGPQIVYQATSRSAYF